MTTENAIAACDNAAGDCNGFYSLDSTKLSRKCFKSGVDPSKPQRHDTINPNVAFYYKKQQGVIEKPPGNPSDVQPSPVTESDKYYMLRNVSAPGTVVASTSEALKACSNMTTENAIAACDNAADDCNGFYSFDSTKLSRKCFKSGIDTSKPQIHDTINPNVAFYYKK